MYKIVQHTSDNCSCFACSNKRAKQEYVKRIEILSQSIGFTPKIYDIRDVNSINSDKLEQVVRRLSAVIQENEQKLREFSNKKPTFCYECGVVHKKNTQNFITIDGSKKYICPRCVLEKYAKCADCGRLDEKENTHVVSSHTRGMVCTKCFRSYKRCTMCGGYGKTFGTLSFKRFSFDEDDFVIKEQVACQSCKSRMKTCSNCGCGGLDVEEVRGIPLCKSCKDVQRPILEYSFKPIPAFKLGKYEKRRKDTLFFGVEWEFENESQKNHEFYTKKFHSFFKDRLFYIKKDSTIRNGVELVTFPFTWGRFKEDVPAWSNVFAIAQEELRASSSDKTWHGSCGIHIHTSRNAYTTAQLYKKIKFTYKKYNREFIMGISGREKENEYFRFRKVDEEHVPLIAKMKCLQSHERHSAINLQTNSTVEDRIFASTTRSSIFFKNLEFVHAVYYFSRDYSMKKTNWEDFLDYISTKPKTYANLHAYIRQNMPTKYAEYLSAKVGK